MSELKELDWSDVEQLEFVDDDDKIVSSFLNEDGSRLVVYLGSEGGYDAIHADGDGTSFGRPVIRNKPKKLRGFVAIYQGKKGGGLIAGCVVDSKDDFIQIDKTRVAIIDLSQFNEGHGL